MTNGEKFKTAQERAEAFRAFCDANSESHHGCGCVGCPLQPTNNCHFAWLDLEAEEEKHETIDDIVREMKGLHDAGDWLGKPDGWDEENVVEALKHYADRIEAAHNRVAKKCREGKE